MKKNKEDIIIELSERATRFAIESREIINIDLEHVPFRNFTYYYPTACVTKGEGLNEIAEIARNSGLKLDPIQLNLLKRDILKTNTYVNVTITNDRMAMSVQDDSRAPLLEFYLPKETGKPVITYNYAEHTKLKVSDDFKSSDSLQVFIAIIGIMTFNVLGYLVKPKELITKVTRPIKDEIKVQHKRVPQKSHNKQPKYITKKVYLVDDMEQFKPVKDRTYTRHVDSWNVCGHWRTYKSGKRTWIPQSVRGKKDSNTAPKEVKIANMK